jgi:Ca2+-binding RTX toxin-like protein
MPTLTFLRSTPGSDLAMSSDMLALLEDAPILSRSSTQLVFSASDEVNDQVTFKGTGLSYTVVNGEVVDVPTGTVTSIVYKNLTSGETYVNWTGLSVSARVIVADIMTNNWTDLNALLFNSADTYNLTNGADQARGFGGNDVMHGFGGNDVLAGDAGRDKLFGDAGADKLSGGLGADTLVGGAGIDRLAGGGGADVFEFTSKGATNRDIISDFNPVFDAMRFAKTAFSAFSYTGQLHSADFVNGTAAADSADRFIYQKSTGNLWYDADGSGSAAKILMAELVDGTAMTFADIFIF